MAARYHYPDSKRLRFMDIYRFFHPHHNPRLHSTPLRQQELSELAQAASELRKALERAMKRTERKAQPPILPQHFQDMIKAARFIERSLETLVDAHPGDTETIIMELINERSEFLGWDTWSALVREQLVSANGFKSEDWRSAKSPEKSVAARVKDKSC